MIAPKLTHVEFLSTEDCNMACSYCFHEKKNKHMSMETFDRAMSLLEPHMSDRVMFTFFGGEPFLNFDFIKNASDKCRQKYPKTSFFVSTNCTIYSDEIVEFIKGIKKNTLQFSYDGIDQERNRGSNELVRENIKKYLNALPRSQVTCKLTFTNETVYNLCESIKDVYNLGIPSVMHGSEDTDKWTEEQLSEYNRQLDLIYEFIADKDNFKVKHADCRTKVGLSIDEYGCSAGKNYITVSCDGDIFPCHRAVSNPAFKIGNVYTGRFNRGSFLTAKVEGCESCEARGGCHVCYFANFEYTGDISKPLPCVCSINKYEFKKAKEVYQERYAGEDRIYQSMIPVLEGTAENVKETLKILGG